MYECNYSREPVNFRLLALKMLKRIWLIPVSIVAGIVLICGTYYLYKTAVSGRTYKVTNIYYIDFAEDTSGKQYDWVNQYTWNTLADMDVFIDGVYDSLTGTVSKEKLCEYSDCTVESDGRYLYLYVTTPDPALSKEISDAYEKELFAFCDKHKEFNSIVCEHSGEAVDNSNIRTGAVSVVGGCVGLLVLLVIWILIEMNDTSIYLPSTIEERYHIPTLGCASMKEFEENCKFLLKGEKTAVVFADSAHGEIKLPGTDTVLFDNICEFPDLTDGVRECSKVVVAVKSGNKNGKTFERLIEQLKRQDIRIDGVMLTEEDSKLIKSYYRR